MKYLLLTSMISLNAFGMEPIKKTRMVTVPKKEIILEEFRKANLVEFANHAAPLIERASGKQFNHIGLEFGIHSTVSDYVQKQYPIIVTEADAQYLKKTARKIIFQQNFSL